MSAEVARRLAAVIKADVVGYSRLMAEDEGATVRAVEACRDHVEALATDHGGRLVNFVGDSFLAEFPTTVSCVRCALAIQREPDPSPEPRICLRMGVHVGDVRVEGDRIFGSGINIAARLEPLADPGGICISGAVREHLRGTLELDYEDLGEQQVKNIPDSVHVFRVIAAEDAPGPPTPLGSEPAGTATRRPAIAVLPFDNLSGDPEQQYLVDGITEDLITRLSRSREFAVISRTSTFAYKGEATDIRRVSRELGARYVVEGSVRKFEDRVRTTAQLIDAKTGHHVWAERYDRQFGDILALQDEIAREIVGTMCPELTNYQTAEIVRQPPLSLAAWELLLRAGWHLMKKTKKDNAEARTLYQRAIERDPHLARGHAYLAFTYFDEINQRWTGDVQQSLRNLQHHGQKAVDTDVREPAGHIALGCYHMLAAEGDRAVDCFEQAIRLAPSWEGAHSILGQFLASSGRPEDAIEHLEEAIRLSPRSGFLATFQFGLATAHFAAGRYEESLGWALKSRQGTGSRPTALGVRTHGLVAACHALLGHPEAARRSLDGMHGITLSDAAQFLGDSPIAERVLEGLRRAGLDD